MERLAISISISSSSESASSTFLLRNFGEIGALLDQLGELELIILLVLQQLANFEAGQLAADVVLRLDSVQKP
jgi:hypothetical protein